MAFDLDPNNFLGHAYSVYVSNLQELALSQPSVYFKMKRQMIDRVKSGMTRSIFANISSLLKEGKITPGGNHIFAGISEGQVLIPAYPSQKINTICLSACETLDRLLEEVCELLMPSEITKILGDKLEQKGRQSVAL
jgi:hypothetical protein